MYFGQKASTASKLLEPDVFVYSYALDSNAAPFLNTRTSDCSMASSDQIASS